MVHSASRAGRRRSTASVAGPQSEAGMAGLDCMDSWPSHPKQGSDPTKSPPFPRLSKGRALNPPLSGASIALVMERVEGEDLSTYIARRAIPIAEALPIARQIACGA